MNHSSESCDIRGGWQINSISVVLSRFFLTSLSLSHDSSESCDKTSSRRRSIVTFLIIYVMCIDDTIFVTNAGLRRRKIVMICGSRRRSIVTFWIIFVMFIDDTQFVTTAGLWRRKILIICGLGPQKWRRRPQMIMMVTNCASSINMTYMIQNVTIRLLRDPQMITDFLRHRPTVVTNCVSSINMTWMIQNVTILLRRDPQMITIFLRHRPAVAAILLRRSRQRMSVYR